jgi:hypothetical protein
MDKSSKDITQQSACLQRGPKKQIDFGTLVEIIREK